MAKSLRASSSLAAKAVKRKAVFQKYVDERALRIAEKLKAEFVKQKMEELRAKNGNGENVMDVDDLGNLEEEKDDKKTAGGDIKISTSGWRPGRHQTFKKKKYMKKSKQKKASFMKF